MNTKLLHLNNSTIFVSILFSIALLFAFLLYPRIGVIDIDAITYIIGTYSLKSGNGYQDFEGVPITTWPPGYSLILSVFPLKPLVTATIVNNISFSVAIIIVYCLAKQNRWSNLFALCFTSIIAAGFFRSIAFFAKPDILTYALFLVGTFIYWQPRSTTTRFWAFTLWNLLIPIKLVTAVITPAALLSELIIDFHRHGLRLNIRSYIYPTLSWFLSLGSLLLYNRWVSSAAMPINHAPASFIGFFQEIVDFIISIPRTTLSYWYGTLNEPIALMCFGISLFVGVLAVSTLRPNWNNHQHLYFGLLLVLLTFALLIVRKFDANIRTMGYGILIILLMFRPITLNRSHIIWIAYATTMLISTFLNVFLVNGQGINLAMYETLANQMERSLPTDSNTTIYSNGYKIIDLHLGIPSITNSNAPPSTRGNYYLLVNLPNVDGIMQTVGEPPMLNDEWCSLREGIGGTLYQPCDFQP